MGWVERMSIRGCVSLKKLYRDVNYLLFALFGK